MSDKYFVPKILWQSCLYGCVTYPILFYVVVSVINKLLSKCLRDYIPHFNLGSLLMQFFSWHPPFLFHYILSVLFSVRVNCPRLSRTTEDPQSLWKNKRWSGQTLPCRAYMKTHRALEAERLICILTVGQKQTTHRDWSQSHVYHCPFLFYYMFCRITSEHQLSRNDANWYWVVIVVLI